MQRNPCGDPVRCDDGFGFFFPWPLQEYQVYDENTNRVALRRRLPEDDSWVVPHNLYMSMFNPSTINVIAFDPEKNSDQVGATVAIMSLYLRMSVGIGGRGQQ